MDENPGHHSPASKLAFGRRARCILAMLDKSAVPEAFGQPELTARNPGIRNMLQVVRTPRETGVHLRPTISPSDP